MDTKGNLSAHEAENHSSQVVDLCSRQGLEHSSLGQQEKRVRPLEQALTLEVSRLARQLDALKLQIGERAQKFSKLDDDFESFCRMDEENWNTDESVLSAPLGRRTKALRALKAILRNRRSLYRHHSGTAALIACLVMPGLVTWYGLMMIGPRSSVARLAPNAQEIVYKPSLSQADSKVTAQATYPNLLAPAPAPATPDTTAATATTQNTSAILPLANSSALAPANQPAATSIQPAQPRALSEYEHVIYNALIDRDLAAFNTALEQAYKIDSSFHNLKDLRRTYMSLKISGASESQILYALQIKVIRESQRWLTPEQLQQLENQV